jgi:hypothetical protein
MDQKLSQVYLVKFLTTNEAWYSEICASLAVALRVVGEHGITKAHDSGIAGCWHYSDPRDASQTAMIVEKQVTY